MRSEASGVRFILIATVASYLLQTANAENAIALFALWPLQGDFLPWQVITYAFLHGGIGHLFFNMYGLWLFGSEIEISIGRRPFLTLYFVSILFAAATQLIVTSITGDIYPTIGASGGVFGILLAYGLFFPKRVLVLLIPPIPMPAWLFVTLYAIIELVLGVTGSVEGVAHFAHLGGMLGAFTVIRHWLRRSL
jgi:membrane associated rhomboid family serine protease